MTYAIIETGGKQVRVEPGKSVKIEQLPVEEKGAVVFDKVLLVSGDQGVRVGTPYVKGASVTGEVVGQGKGKKVVVFKYKRKVNYRRTRGHRQPFTEVTIKAVQAN